MVRRVISGPPALSDRSVVYMESTSVVATTTSPVTSIRRLTSPPIASYQATATLCARVMVPLSDAPVSLRRSFGKPRPGLEITARGIRAGSLPRFGDVHRQNGVSRRCLPFCQTPSDSYSRKLRALRAKRESRDSLHPALSFVAGPT